MDPFDALALDIEAHGIDPHAARKLFASSVLNKRADHWKLCLASYYVVGLRDGSTERLAREADSISVDSVEDYARTFRLNRSIRIRFDRVRLLGIGRDPKHKAIYEKAFRQVLFDLAGLREELHYTKWLIVANAVYTGYKTKDGRKRLTLPQALDALKSGADGNTESFAAFVAGSEISLARAMRKSEKALSQLLSFPMAKNKRRKIKAAYNLIEMEVKGHGKNKANPKAR